MAAEDNVELVDRIKSGKYFTDARKWYNAKYLYPYVERSRFLSFFVVIFAVLLGLVYTIDSMLPLSKGVKYAIKVGAVDNNRAMIHHLQNDSESTLNQIARIALNNYMVHREQYNYNKLSEQITFVKKNSSSTVFKEFYEYIKLTNPDSPVLRYQKYGRRDIKVDSIRLGKNNKAIIYFHSTATNFDGKKFEDLKWRATIGYTQDPINLKVKDHSDYHFVVTSYKYELLK